MTTTSQITFEFDHRPAMGWEDFLVASCNEAAVDMIDRWPDWPAPAVCMYGPPGCGKTHLAQVFCARSGGALVAASAFGAMELDALLAKGVTWAIEDADRGVDETKLFHFYNLIAERNGHLLLTAESPPARWTVELEDLRSRLTALPALAVGAPDEGLIGAVLVKQFADRQLRVEQDVITYLVMHMERSFEAARRVAAALDTAALVGRRRITVPLARDVLRDENLG
ncbi:MAG: DnaA/Hda family protein [Alphaproteobacteria bacterium]|nr:DnaA/Hda family protein [Alphaproteobacteria bacterium]